jgi:hypothetical protein
VNTRKQTCKAHTKKGQRCRAPSLPGSDFCFFHDPKHATERAAAQSAGGRCGRIKALPGDTPDVDVANCTDVVSLISATINQVRRGEVDPRVANAVGYLANVLIRAVEQSDIEARLAELEAIVNEQRQSCSVDLKEA